MNAIEIEDLWIGFDEEPVLQGVNLKVEANRNTIIAGTSGVGKTILLKSVIGLLKPNRGRITINGEDTSGYSAQDWYNLRMQIGMVFQGNALFDSMSVWENVGFFFLEHTRKSAEQVRREAEQALKLVDLEGTGDLYPEELSGGMKKRVALARTLLFNPKIILYDEPSSGLDPVTSEGIKDLMRSIHKQFGTTALIVSHDLLFMQGLAERVGLLDQGRIVGFGPLEELQQSSDPLVSNFFRIK